MAVNKVETELDKVKNKSQAAGTIYEKRLDDMLAGIKKQVATAIKDMSSLPSSKGTAKKRS